MDLRAVDRTGHVAPDETGDPSRFIAHIEGRTRVLEEAPGSFATAEEAVAWARARADVVLVRLPGEGFRRSAGPPHHPAVRDLPPWPP